MICLREHEKNMRHICVSIQLKMYSEYSQGIHWWSMRWHKVTPGEGVATAVGKVATTMGRFAYSELERSGAKTLWKATVGCPTYSERDLVQKLLSRSAKSWDFLAAKTVRFLQEKRSKLWKTERSFILDSLCKIKTLWDIEFSPELIGAM